MAAFALENSNRVWEKVKGALDAQNASPAAKAQFKDLKLWLATQKNIQTLQFLPFSAAEAAVAGGTVLATGAANLYGFFVKKTGATTVDGTATRNTVKLYDDATNDTTADDQVVTADLLAIDQEFVLAYPQGYALAVGATITVHTTPIGTTDGTAANSGPGFVIVG